MPMSNAYTRFAANPKVKAVLKRKVGDEGFSLIELVVVVAVLAILAAVALPNFLGVQKDAQVATAKNTLATIVKECVTSSLRGSGTNFASIQTTQGKINGFSLSTVGTNITCFQAKAIGEDDLPDYQIVYNQNTGTTAKTCNITSGDYRPGCFTASNLSVMYPAATTGAGSW